MEKLNPFFFYEQKAGSATQRSNPENISDRRTAIQLPSRAPQSQRVLWARRMFSSEAVMSGRPAPTGVDSDKPAITIANIASRQTARPGATRRQGKDSGSGPRPGVAPRP